MSRTPDHPARDTGANRGDLRPAAEGIAEGISDQPYPKYQVQLGRIALRRA